MKKEQRKEENKSGTQREKQKKEDATTALPKMEMYAILGLEMSKQILEKLQEVVDSLETLAQQKWRELHTDKPDAEPGP